LQPLLKPQKLNVKWKLPSSPIKLKLLLKQLKKQLKPLKNQSQELKVLKKQPPYLLRKLNSQLNLLNKLKVHQFKQRNLLKKQQNQPKKHKLLSQLTKLFQRN
jgi:hypothetical protein